MWRIYVRTSRIENELQVRERRRETNYERNVHSKYHMVFSPLILEIGPVLVPFGHGNSMRKH
jgi:hypothetical protein